MNRRAGSQAAAGRKHDGASEARLALLASIVDSSDDAIISKTLDGIITSWNPGAETIYGYKAKEIIGKPFSLLVPKDRPDEMVAILKEIRDGNRVEHYETVRLKKDGSTISVSLTVSPIHDGNGNIIAASSIARDVTERKRADHPPQGRAPDRRLVQRHRLSRCAGEGSWRVCGGARRDGAKAGLAVRAQPDRSELGSTGHD